MLLPMEVLPTPGGPTKQRILPWVEPHRAPTAMNSMMRSWLGVGVRVRGEGLGLGLGLGAGWGEGWGSGFGLELHATNLDVVKAVVVLR